MNVLELTKGQVPAKKISLLFGREALSQKITLC